MSGLQKNSVAELAIHSGPCLLSYMAHYCIIGAGISGLAIAWQLKRRGHSCTVLERSETPGGALHSVSREGFLAEDGPHSILLNNPDVEAFLQSIPGLESRMVESDAAANKRYILRSGRPHAVPTGPFTAITSQLWSLRGKLRVLREPFIPPASPEEEETVAAFVRRRLGNELYEYAINPLVGGIYAGDPEQLSLRHGFPKLYALEQQHRSLIRGALAKKREAKANPKNQTRKRIISFHGGMGELPLKIAAALGENFRTGVKLHSLRKQGDKWDIGWTEADGSKRDISFDRVVLAVPAHQLPALPAEASLQANLETFSGIQYPPVSVLSLGFDRNAVEHPLDGFGMLVPEKERRSILGVLFPSTFFPGRAPKDKVLLTAFVGGDRQPETATPDTKKLQNIVIPELESLLGVRGEPEFAHHRHWDRAIPQYKIGHGKWFERMAALEREYPGLHLAGNYRTGISVTYCLEAAIRYPSD
ncbi:MAG: protoporphyrinogen oxidase [Opitutales bacterium]